MAILSPKTPREFFDLLVEYNRNYSIEQFLSHFDWSNVSVHQIYNTILDRLPESAATVRNQKKLEPLTLAVNALNSVEFQNRSIELLLRAYPERRRLLHVHIPKTAGTDLRDALIARIPHVQYNHTLRELTSVPILIAHLADTARRIQTTDEIFITGHIPLKWFVDRRLCRPEDRLFSIVRHPVESILSAVNYRIRRISEDPDCEKPDTKVWAKLMGVDRFPRSLNDAEKYNLGLVLLRTKSIISDGLATEMLGQKSIETAIDLIVRTNIELIPIESYNSWMKQTWGFDPKTRANQSPSVLSLSNIDVADIQFLNEFCREDILLYERIIAAYKRSGGYRLFGADLLGC